MSDKQKAARCSLAAFVIVLRRNPDKKCSLLDFSKANILVFHPHRLASMKLQGEDTIEKRQLGIIVSEVNNLCAV